MRYFRTIRRVVFFLVAGAFPRGVEGELADFFLFSHFLFKFPPGFALAATDGLEYSFCILSRQQKVARGKKGLKVIFTHTKFGRVAHDLRSILCSLGLVFLYPVAVLYLEACYSTVFSSRLSLSARIRIHGTRASVKEILGA